MAEELDPEEQIVPIADGDGESYHSCTDNPVFRDTFAESRTQEPAPAPASTGKLPAKADAPDVLSDEDAPAGEVMMSLGDHIGELRTHIIKGGLTVIAVLIAASFLYQKIWAYVLLPRDWAARSLEKTPQELFQIVRLGPLDGFLSVVKILLALAFIIAMPMIIYQLWAFVRPALKPEEKKAMLAIFSFGSFMFFAGVAVAFFFAAPLGLEFLIRFNQTLPGTLDRWTMQGYLGFLIMTCLGFGICFETPLAMMALAYTGIITPKLLTRYWRHALMVMVVLAAVFTPPDPMTQILLASMMACLYGLGYLLTLWVVRRKARKEEDGPDAAEQS